MIELIGVVCCIVAIVGLPIQTAKVRAGTMPKKFKGTYAEYLAFYRKQLGMMFWFGIVIGVLNGVMAAVPQDEPYEWIVKLVAAVLGAALAALAYFTKRSLQDATTPSQA